MKSLKSNAPMLGGDRRDESALTGNEPALGGDRAYPPGNCEVHDIPLQRTFDGSFACMACVGTKPHAAGVTRSRLPDDPDWFHVSKNTPVSHIINVRAGWHPIGLPLLQGFGHEKCGNCRHRWVHRRSKNYQKCHQIKATSGSATDVRIKWPGCAKWEPVGD